MRGNQLRGPAPYSARSKEPADFVGAGLQTRPLLHPNPASRPALCERLDRGTRADQIAVAVGVVDPGHRRPELGLLQIRQRIRGLLPRVGMAPLVGGDFLRSV